MAGRGGHRDIPLPVAPRYHPRAMAEITNLNRFRKQRSRDDARRAGDANAAKFGRTRAERAAEAQDATRAARHLDQHRRETPDGDDA